MIFSFHPYNESYAQTRSGEERIGERLIPYSNFHDAKYLILGVSEDIGPKANLGKGGANKAFDAFLSYFIHMQSNRFLSGDDVCILGTLNCQETNDKSIALTEWVERLDTYIIDFLLNHWHPDQKLVVIGGGHNNALPIIQALHIMRKMKLDIVNMDPHADCRELEGRHSGNSFSYAVNRNLINSYNVIGLHRAYNNETSLSFLEKQDTFYSFFEDYILEPNRFEQDIHVIRKKLSKATAVGIELDLDAIANMPSSARTPSGFSVEEARKYISVLSNLPQVTYLHLPEGAPTNPIEVNMVGKTLAYLVWDFLYQQKRE